MKAGALLRLFCVYALAVSDRFPPHRSMETLLSGEGIGHSQMYSAALDFAIASVRKMGVCPSGAICL